MIVSEAQVPIQRYGRRPFGVGLLVAGFDELGPHLYQTCPSGNFYECKAMAIGARSQSARTYLEKHLATFNACSLDELIKHALRSLRETLPNEIELSTKVYCRIANDIKSWSNSYLCAELLVEHCRQRHDLHHLR